MEEKSLIGTRMKAETCETILRVMSDPVYDGKTQKELAEIIGIAARTLRNYLTPNMWNRIRKERLNVVQKYLERVDKAVFTKAMEGDIAAARLIYSRWRDIQETEKQIEQEEVMDDEQLHDVDEEIKTLRSEIAEIEQQLPFAKGKGEAS